MFSQERQDSISSYNSINVSKARKYWQTYHAIPNDTIALCALNISTKTLDDLYNEWKTNPITTNLYHYDANFKAHDIKHPFWTFCPYIQAKEKELGLYIYTNRCDFDVENSGFGLMPRHFIQMYIPILRFENEIIVTDNITTKRSELKRFLALYSDLFTKEQIMKMRKMYLKVAFDPLMPDFPLRVNGRLPVWNDKVEKIPILLNNSLEMKKVQKYWRKSQKYASVKSFFKYKAKRVFLMKCDSCFSYYLRKCITNDSLKIGLYFYSQELEWNEYTGESANAANYLIPILVFSDKIAVSNNLKRKKQYLKEFLLKYQSFFSTSEIKVLSNFAKEKKIPFDMYFDTWNYQK